MAEFASLVGREDRERPAAVQGSNPKSDYLKKLEVALDVRPFVAHLDRILEDVDDDDDDEDEDESDDEDEDDESDDDDRNWERSAAKIESKSSPYNLYNVGVDDERSLLLSVLLSDSSSRDSEDDVEPVSEARLSRMLRDHLERKKYAERYYRNPENSQYMYYGAGTLSVRDRWTSSQRETTTISAFGPSKKKKPKPNAPNSRSRPSKSPRSDEREGRDDEFSVGDAIVKEEPEDVDDVYGGSDSRISSKSRKRISSAKRPEVLAARRRKFWQAMVKKEMGKVQRTRAAAHKDTLQNCKRMAALCTKHHRQKAMQSQKNMKETVWRCKRLTREMQAYWKRYDRVERETRKRMEKEAEEQRKLDIELIEAKRQQRKLNFLITQTELYAHFMSKKIGRETPSDEQLRILSQLDEDRGPKRLSHLDTYDVDAMKEKAARNAAEAFNADTNRKREFDRTTGVKGVNDSNPDAPPGEFCQPSMFRGTLKSYQLKGMNWLANLYDQGISGILADEMGLGKTVQCIAFLCHVAEKLGIWGPFLVVSPASTLHNWQQEMERFIPDFKVVPYWGSPNERKILRQFWERKDLHTRDAAFHVVITSYQLVVSDLKYLNRVKWQYMILDEAQAIKSSASLRWKLLLSFNCRNRLLLSGTPIQNSMAELWALLHFIMPTLFDSHDEFNEWFSKDIESHAENKTAIDEKHLSRLHMILKPFMLRRIKKDVENELSDKIEIMVYCPLTTRQKLLYLALKKKIRVEDLIHFSTGGEPGHSFDKNFTSNLMNLVMQFRKVCNHPELFERRDVKSPLFMKCEDYAVPKIVAEDIFLKSSSFKEHLLYNKFNIFATDHINRDLFHNENVLKTFSFSRFIDLSPCELYRFAAGDLLFVISFLLYSKNICDNIRHRYRWWSNNLCNEILLLDNNIREDSTNELLNYAVKNTYYDACLSKHRLIICRDSSKLICVKRQNSIWNDLLFTYPINISDPMTYSHTDHEVFNMPETLEHRRIRSKHLLGLTFSHESETLNKNFLPMALSKHSDSSDINEVLVPEFPHQTSSSECRTNQPTSLPKFLFSSTVKVHCGERKLYGCSRAVANKWLLSNAISSRILKVIPPPELSPSVSFLTVPDKQTLVTDAGKLNVLDGLLTKLKLQGHRVLIYSQMTKMIDLLEEYMWHRKHKYMRLDGSSKISARRDMVADFQARTDIFVFLLSTRAGGLGINLTAADTVIFYDSDWNPTVDQQAMDRAHRLGQTKQVTVYRLICKGTIEERIMQRAREKSEIQRMVISGSNFKPDTLKPKEVVSLLLDDEELELKYRQRAEEKKLIDEIRMDGRTDKEKKRKHGLSPKGNDQKRQRGGSGGESGPCSPEPTIDQEPDIIGTSFDDASNEALVIDIENPPGSSSSAPFYEHDMLSTKPCRTPGRGSRRGRPRGSRHSLNRCSSRIGVQEYSSFEGTSRMPGNRRGPGRPRMRTSVLGNGTRLSSRGRRNRGPLLVPLGNQPSTSSSQ